MKPIQIINNDYTHKLHIGFIIGTTCNYKCHYCFDGCNDGKYRFPADVELLKTNLAYIINFYRDNVNKTDIRLHITGGEPTLWPELGEFTQYVTQETGAKVSLSTNGTRTLRFWKQYARYFDDIGISIHNERCNPNHIIEVMDEVYNNSPDVLINGTVLMDPFNWDKSAAIAEQLIAHPTPWVLKVRPVLFDGEMKHFSQDQIEFMRRKVEKIPPLDRIDRYKELGVIQQDEPDIKVLLDNGTEVKYNTFNILENNWQHFEGWECNLGIDRFAIERDGAIQGACGQKTLFNLDHSLNIYDPSLPNKYTLDMIRPTICQQRQCLCATDIRLPKRIIKIYE
tara:strand:+ start:1899 stop:2915 length:1017 start_codon:yes stop_codon:yes gene_type:complete